MFKKQNFDYDLVVIGSGAAGGTAALMAAGAGLKTAIVEAKSGAALTLIVATFHMLLHHISHRLMQTQDSRLVLACLQKMQNITIQQFHTGANLLANVQVLAQRKNLKMLVLPA